MDTITNAELDRILKLKRWIDPPFTLLAAWFVLAPPSDTRQLALTLITVGGIALRLKLYGHGIFGAALRRPANAGRIYAIAMFIWIMSLTTMFLITDGVLVHAPTALMLAVWVSVLRTILSRRASQWVLLLVRPKSERRYRFWPLGYRIMNAPA